MLPHHVTSFATLALADNCKLWSGNQEMEKNLALPLAGLYWTLARINVLLQKITLLLRAKPQSSNERG